LNGWEIIMDIRANHLGMPLDISELDRENLTYFRHCAAHAFHLQACAACALIRYPPSTACPWCASPDARWVPVEGRGTVHSYTEVHHAIQPAFRAHTPYLILLVDIDTQKGQPTADEALRVVGNLTTADGVLAPPEMIRKVGIGTRVRMVFTDVTPGLALPQWTLEEAAAVSAPPWRYPQE
jgi:uncharacterized protein